MDKSQALAAWGGGSGDSLDGRCGESTWLEIVGEEGELRDPPPMAAAAPEQKTRRQSGLDQTHRRG